MSKEEKHDLLGFLSVFSQEVQELVLSLREFIWEKYPEANELIYDNYNALAIGWSPSLKSSQTFSTISIFRANSAVHFGFYWGSILKDPENILLGSGKQYRYILVKNRENLPKNYLINLMQEAYPFSLSKTKPGDLNEQGKTITKSISEKKKEKKKPS